MVLEPLPTAELADAAGTPIAMDARIRPVWVGAELAGPAFTVRAPAGVFPSMKEAAGQAPAGAVLVVDGGGDLGRALSGDRMSKLALERGLVVDGAIRDRHGIEALGFPVFAAGSVPTPPVREGSGSSTSRSRAAASRCGRATWSTVTRTAWLSSPASSTTRSSRGQNVLTVR